MARVTTIRVEADTTDAEAKLERLIALAERLKDLWPYFQDRAQEADYCGEPEAFTKAAAPAGEIVGDEDGLTDAEREVSEHLVAAVNAFGRLDRRHPDEDRDFTDGIHACQGQLILRIVQRCYPKAWPVKRPE